MAFKIRDFITGIRLRLTTYSSGVHDKEGALYLQNDTTNRIKTYVDGVKREVITNDQSQTLTNKTLDIDNNILSNVETDNLKAGVLNTDLTGTSTNAQVPSALASKTYTTNSISTHAGLTTTHGVTGTIVGTSDSQILTNKTIVAASNTISGLLHGTQVDNPVSGVHGVIGNIVGTSDNQTLTTKTIDANNNIISNIDTTNLKAGVLNTNLAGGATNLQIPSALAAKNYSDTVGGNLAAHAALTTAHGTTSTIVGISDSQTLTNKTIVAGNNTISGLLHGTHVDSPSSGVHGVVGSVVGTTDSQTLSNKTLTAPSVTGTISHTGYDIAYSTQSLLQSQSNTTIINLSAYKSARILLYVQIGATTSLFETFDIMINKRTSDYQISTVSVGDQSLISFSITTVGILQYTSPTYPGFTSGSVYLNITALK